MRGSRRIRRSGRPDAIREDKRHLNRFLKTWFWDEKEGVFKGSQREFADTLAFEEMLERHLEKLLGCDWGTSARPAARWHRGSPFRGLQPSTSSMRCLLRPHSR